MAGDVTAVVIIEVLTSFAGVCRSFNDRCTWQACARTRACATYGASPQAEYSTSICIRTVGARCIVILREVARVAKLKLVHLRVGAELHYLQAIR